MSDFPEFQHKPEKRLNYKEKFKESLLSGKLKRNSSIPLVSKKHKKELDKYNRMCYNDADNQICFKCGQMANKNVLDRHHTHGRSGDNLFKYEYCCKECHAWIHENPNEARSKGYLCF